jgi:hypothetical protein
VSLRQCPAGEERSELRKGEEKGRELTCLPSCANALCSRNEVMLRRRVHGEESKSDRTSKH